MPTTFPPFGKPILEPSALRIRPVTSPVASALDRPALLAQLKQAFAAQNTSHSTLETLREGALEIRRLLVQFKKLGQPLTHEDVRMLLRASFFDENTGCLVALTKPNETEAEEVQIHWAIQNEARRNLCDSLLDEQMVWLGDFLSAQAKVYAAVYGGQHDLQCAARLTGDSGFSEVEHPDQQADLRRIPPEIRELIYRSAGGELAPFNRESFDCPNPPLAACLTVKPTMLTRVALGLPQDSGKSRLVLTDRIKQALRAKAEQGILKEIDLSSLAALSAEQTAEVMKDLFVLLKGCSAKKLRLNLSGLDLKSAQFFLHQVENVTRLDLTGCKHLSAVALLRFAECFECLKLSLPEGVDGPDALSQAQVDHLVRLLSAETEQAYAKVRQDEFARRGGWSSFGQGSFFLYHSPSDYEVLSLCEPERMLVEDCVLNVPIHPAIFTAFPNAFQNLKSLGLTAGQAIFPQFLVDLQTQYPQLEIEIEILH
ncbi:MAG: hypothetical protein V4623_09040 [Pseudomonadota bacterium]